MIVVLITPPDQLYELPVTVTAKDLAKVLHRSVRWIELQVKAGTLNIPRVEEGPGLLWRREDVQRYLGNTTTQAPDVVEMRRAAEATTRTRRMRKAAMSA